MRDINQLNLLLRLALSDSRHDVITGLLKAFCDQVPAEKREELQEASDSLADLGIRLGIAIDIEGDEYIVYLDEVLSD